MPRRSGACPGATPAVPTSPSPTAGREAARRVAPRLTTWRFGLVLVSPSRRARETCELCGFGAHAQVEEDLLEWDYGEYEGLTSEEILERRPDWVLWRDGCPGGELPDQVGARADRVIASLSDGPAPAAIFAHGHILRVLGARWISLGADGGGRLALSTGALCTLGDEHGRAVISSWNDTGATGSGSREGTSFSIEWGARELMAAPRRPPIPPPTTPAHARCDCSGRASRPSRS